MHVLLFLLTLVTTTLVGGQYYRLVRQRLRPPAVTFDLCDLLWQGLWYSVPVLGILGAHEMGHYLLCRRYDVDATLPYFIPLPCSSTGTLGAVIKIREPFPTRTALFDIGVAGPIAGFVVLVPPLFFGMAMSNVVPAPHRRAAWRFGEPLLFQCASVADVRRRSRTATALNMHPMVFAAWFGMLATALNLLPFGQLDGGHLTYATLGGRSTLISARDRRRRGRDVLRLDSWLLMTVMMVVDAGPPRPAAPARARRGRAARRRPVRDRRLRARDAASSASRRCRSSCYDLIEGRSIIGVAVVESSVTTANSDAVDDG